MTYLIRIGDIYFHDLGNNPYRFFGMELWVREGRAEFDRGVRWCRSKGHGQGKELFRDASTFARVMPVQNDCMQMSSMRTLEVSPMYSMLKIMYGCAYPRL